MAKKVMTSILVDPNSGRDISIKKGEYTPGEGLADPDGARVYTAAYPPPGGGALPISGLKGAVVVVSGSSTVFGIQNIVLGEPVTPGAHKWFWSTVFASQPGLGVKATVAGLFGATNEYVLHVENFAGSGFFFYKVYKIDES
jgi:hypothetical protein